MFNKESKCNFIPNEVEAQLKRWLLSCHLLRFKLTRILNSVHMAIRLKDLGQFSIQSAQILTA